MVPSTLFWVLLVSAVIWHLQFLHRKEVVKFLLHFGKILQSSTKKSKDCNPSTARIIFMDHLSFWLPLLFKLLWIFYDCINLKMCFTIQQELLKYYIYAYLQLRAKPRFKKHFFFENCWFYVLQNKLIQTTIISFSESTFKMK